jgi:hypothetical protein
MFFTYLECVMRMKGDITDVNPNEILHQMANELINYTVNDRIFTSARELGKVVVTKTGGSGYHDEWEHGDNVEW